MHGQLLTPLEAGSVYRAEKLNTFISEADLLGNANDPAVRTLLSQIASLNVEIEELRAKQEVGCLAWSFVSVSGSSSAADLVSARQEGSSQAPWWADGEYDKDSADRCCSRSLSMPLTFEEVGRAFNLQSTAELTGRGLLISRQSSITRLLQAFQTQFGCSRLLQSITATEPGLR